MFTPWHARSATAGIRVRTGFVVLALGLAVGISACGTTASSSPARAGAPMTTPAAGPSPGGSTAHIPTPTLSPSTAPAVTLVPSPTHASSTPSTSPTPPPTTPPTTPPPTTAPSTPSTSPTPPTTPASKAPTTPPPANGNALERAFHQLTAAQRVGQLFMVGTPATGLSQAAVDAVRQHHVGSVILTGRSHEGVAATRNLTDRIHELATPAATGGLGFVIAADQEGGNVQVLQGPGFSDMPTALTQGTWSPTTLRNRAHTWAEQLHQAGVNLNLAPIMDTVPAKLGHANRPIGYWDREFGHSPSVVASHGTAFQAGMQSAGVQVTLKHFPGLGRVRGNTDTDSGVVDHVTTRHDPYLQPFQAGVDNGAAFVMVSTAGYSHLSGTTPAAFSSTIIRGMLRGDLGFDGVVISDDLGNAQQVQQWTPGQRAVKFLTAGGDLVLTVNAALIPAMTQAVLHRYQANPGFRRTVDQSVLHILQAKQRMGLLH